MSESTGDKAADAAPTTPAFKFEVGQQVVYRHPTDGQCDAKIRDRWIDISGIETYLLKVPIDYRVNTGGIIPSSVSDLSALTPDDRTRLGVESLGLGPAEPIEGGTGHRVRGSTGSPGTLETPLD